MCLEDHGPLERWVGFVDGCQGYGYRCYCDTRRYDDFVQFIKLNNANLKYPFHEKELVAISHALKVWRQYSLVSESKIELIINHCNI